MKKLHLCLMVLLTSIVSMAGTNVFVSQLSPIKVVVVADADGGDVDLYLDCFENAVKAKDMELAAKIANVLYGMNMSEAQQKRFFAIENKISKKDYRVYRDNLRYFASKSLIENDGYYDSYIEPYGDLNDSGYYDSSTFVDDIVDSFSAFFDELGTADSSYNWHYERHDTIDGGGMLDVFVDAFNRFMFDDGGAEISDKSVSADEAEIDALLDEYEKYVILSVGALRDVMLGNSDSMDDFEKYSKEASRLSDEIGKAGNGMNSRQFKRYMHILGNMVTGLF